MDDGQAEGNYADTELNPSGTAFFFDFDGTLAAIVDDPEQVRITPRTGRALGVLQEISGGALAIISGREIAALDRFLAPLQLPASGIHGLEQRDASGTVRRGNYDTASLTRLHDEATAFVNDHPGLIAEEKPGSVALHYRQTPDMEERARQFAEEVAASVPGVAIMHGKMVVELRLGGRSKADAVSDFMAMPPFRGRKPLFAGDDVTDEDAFRFVEKAGGNGIKIGPGQTEAGLRMPERDTFETWLCNFVATLEREGKADLAGGQSQIAAATGTPGPAAAVSGA